MARLDILQYPHILDAVIQFAPHDALLILRSTSKQW